MTTDASMRRSPDAYSTPAADALSGLSAEEFKLAFRNHAAGVSVITAEGAAGPVGLTATSVFSVSATPTPGLLHLLDLVLGADHPGG